MVPLVRLECLWIKVQLRSLHAHPNFQWSPTCSNRLADLVVQYNAMLNQCNDQIYILYFRDLC